MLGYIFLFLVGTPAKHAIDKVDNLTQKMMDRVNLKER